MNYPNNGQWGGNQGVPQPQQQYPQQQYPQQQYQQYPQQPQAPRPQSRWWIVPVCLVGLGVVVKATIASQENEAPVPASTQLATTAGQPGAPMMPAAPMPVVESVPEIPASELAPEFQGMSDDQQTVARTMAVPFIMIPWNRRSHSNDTAFASGPYNRVLRVVAQECSGAWMQRFLQHRTTSDGTARQFARRSGFSQVQCVRDLTDSLPMTLAL